MRMTGLYQMALLGDADEQAFVEHMTKEVFPDPTALQATRITRGFSHRLLRRKGAFRQYAWDVTVDLMTEAGYDFEQNIERVQERIRAFGVLTGVEIYEILAP